MMVHLAEDGPEKVEEDILRVDRGDDGVDLLELVPSLLQLTGPFGDEHLKPPPLRLDPPDPHAVPAESRDQHKATGQQPEPPGLPEGRGDGDRDAGAHLVPQPIAVAALDPEHVRARIDVGVGREGLRAGLHPSPVEALQDVREAVPGRVGEVQRGEVDREEVVPIRERDPVDLLKGAVEADRLVKATEGAQDHRRRVRVVLDAVRIEDVVAVDAAEVQTPVGGPEGCARAEQAALQTVARSVAAEAPRARVEARQATVGAEPQVARVVAEDAVDVGAGQTLLAQVANKGSGVRVIGVEPVGSADPQ